MASRIGRIIVLAGLALLAGTAAHIWWQPVPALPLKGVVRSTDIRIAPEVGGQLTAIRVEKGNHVRAGDVVAELSALELRAAVGQGRARLDAAKAARDRVYAGVRAEQLAVLAAEVAKTKSRLLFARAQLARTAPLALKSFASRQAFDQAQYDVAAANADLAEAEANHAAAKAGPTAEERGVADAQVMSAATALTVLERRLDKTVLRAPADGVVSVVVAEIGENVHVGQPVLTVEDTGQRWLSFNAREDRLHGLTVGAKVNFTRAGEGAPTRSVVTEILPLGSFATWQAERAVGDHDRNTLRLRFDPEGASPELEPGMTVFLIR